MDSYNDLMEGLNCVTIDKMLLKVKAKKCLVYIISLKLTKSVVYPLWDSIYWFIIASLILCPLSSKKIANLETTMFNRSIKKINKIIFVYF